MFTLCILTVISYERFTQMFNVVMQRKRKLQNFPDYKNDELLKRISGASKLECQKYTLDFKPLN